MPDDVQRWRRTLEGLLGTPCTEGNRITPLRNGDEIFPAMLEAIGSAERTVDLTTFIYWTGDIAVRMAETLADRARAGVRVRVILDAVGSRLMDNELTDLMEDAGVHLHHFRAVEIDEPTKAMHRTHRKVLICDEQVAFTGGVGIAEEWQGDARDETEWRDTHFRLEGPVVDGLRAAFVSDWIESGNPLFDDTDRFPEQPQDGDAVAMVLRGNAEEGYSDIAIALRAILRLAREHVRITTAYFSPDESTTAALCEAARRGVTIDVLHPGDHIDKRLPQLAGELAYEDLLDAGVRLWRYDHTMLHAKVMTVDGTLAKFGSANLNNRSLGLDEEIDVLAIHPGLVAVLDEHFEDDRSRAVRVTDGEWQQRGVLQRIQERAVDIIDDLV